MTSLMFKKTLSNTDVRKITMNKFGYVHIYRNNERHNLRGPAFYWTRNKYKSAYYFFGEQHTKSNHAKLVREFRKGKQ